MHWGHVGGDPVVSGKQAKCMCPSWVSERSIRAKALSIECGYDSFHVHGRGAFGKQGTRRYWVASENDDFEEFSDLTWVSRQVGQWPTKSHQDNFCSLMECLCIKTNLGDNGPLPMGNEWLDVASLGSGSFENGLFQALNVVGWHFWGHFAPDV